MPITNDYPDLNHWRAVNEFTVEQAALLLAGIDPMEWSLPEARKLRVKHWKYAEGFCLALVGALRQGTLSPLTAQTRGMNGDLWEMDVTSRGEDIHINLVILSRASLFAWVEREKLDYVRPAPPRTDVPALPDTDARASRDSGKFLALPDGHTSQGLEYLATAIQQFWSTYDPENCNPPTRHEIIDYLKSKGASHSLAEAVDKVARPDSARAGGRPKGR